MDLQVNDSADRVIEYNIRIRIILSMGHYYVTIRILLSMHSGSKFSNIDDLMTPRLYFAFNSSEGQFSILD